MRCENVRFSSANSKQFYATLFTLPVVEAVYAGDGKMYPAEVILVLKPTDTRSGVQFKVMFLGMQPRICTSALKDSFFDCSTQKN